MFQKLIETAATWTTAPLRLALGVIFIAHGSQKVFGAFAGPGLSKFTAGEAPFPFMRPSWLWLGMAAFSEFVGGALVLSGFLTRIGAFLIACVMATAMLGVHLAGGFFAPKGFEYPFALFFAALALLISGGGNASVDRALMNTRGARRR